MTRYEALDIVLQSMSDPSKWSMRSTSDIHSDTGIDYDELRLLLQHLDKLTYVEVNGDFFNATYAKISLQGLLFLERGGFRAELKRARNNRIWIYTKITANVFEALAIIAISIWAILAQK